ncbi:MAG: hypothetical protein ABW252_09920 [Polyangiales bacterium]
MVCSCVVPQRCAVVTPEALIAHCQARLAKYEAPARVEFMTALPRNAMGKVLKRELRPAQKLRLSVQRLRAHVPTHARTSTFACADALRASRHAHVRREGGRSGSQGRDPHAIRLRRPEALRTPNETRPPPEYGGGERALPALSRDPARACRV